MAALGQQLRGSSLICSQMGVAVQLGACTFHRRVGLGRRPGFFRRPGCVLLGGRLDDPGRHELLEHLIGTWHQVETQLPIHRADRVQQPPHPGSDHLHRRLIGGRQAKIELVLTGVDPLPSDRGQQFQLGLTMG